MILFGLTENANYENNALIKIYWASSNISVTVKMHVPVE